METAIVILASLLFVAIIAICALVRYAIKDDEKISELKGQVKEFLDLRMVILKHFKHLSPYTRMLPTTENLVSIAAKRIADLEKEQKTTIKSLESEVKQLQASCKKWMELNDERSESYIKLNNLLHETRIKASTDFDALLNYAIKTFYFTGKGLVLPDDKHAQSLIIEVDAISLDDAFRVLRNQKRKYAYNAEVRYYVSASTEELAITPKLLTFKEAK